MESKMTKYEFGLNTFGDVAIDDKTGESMTYGESLRNLVQEPSWPMNWGLMWSRLVNITVMNSQFPVLKLC